MIESPKFCVVGPTAIDIKAYTTDPLAPGKTAFGQIYIVPGGPARNIAETLAHLGSECTLLSALGDDFIAHSLLQHLEDAGVSISHVRMVPEMRTSTFVSFGQDRDSEPYIVYNRAVVQHITPEYLRSKHSVITGADCLIVHTDPYSLAAYRSLVESLANSGTQAMPIPVGFSVKAADINDSLVAAFPLANWVFMNQDEASVYSGSSVDSLAHAHEVASELTRRGPSVAIVTLGRRGCVIATKTNVYHVSGVECEVVDHTGAGDAFIAGFAYMMLKTQDPIGSAHFASATAALTVLSEDTVRSDISVRTVEEFLDQHRYHTEELR